MYNKELDDIIYNWKLYINELGVSLEGNLKTGKNFEIYFDKQGYKSNCYPLSVYNKGYGAEWKAIKEIDFSKLFTHSRNMIDLSLKLNIKDKKAIIKVDRYFSSFLVIATKDNIYIPLNLIEKFKQSINKNNYSIIIHESELYVSLNEVKDIPYNNLRGSSFFEKKIEIIEVLNLKKVLKWLDNFI